MEEREAVNNLSHEEPGDKRFDTPGHKLIVKGSPQPQKQRHRLRQNASERETG